MTIAPSNRAESSAPAESVVTKLVARRKALGLRQCDVAARMHVGQSAVCQFERTQNPYMSTLMRYADAVGVSVSVELHAPDRVDRDDGDET
jgi:transcriptional regulator with XRE-family HTH domain